MTVLWQSSPTVESKTQRKTNALKQLHKNTVYTKFISDHDREVDRVSAWNICCIGRGNWHAEVANNLKVPGQGTVVKWRSQGINHF